MTLSAGTHTYTIYAEKYNSYTWTNYTVHLFFELAQSPQTSAMALLNVNSTQFFPPFQAYSEFTEDLAGRSVKTLNKLLYKSGQTEAKLVGYHFSNPTLYNKDRVTSFEVRSDKVMDYIGQITLEVKAPPALRPDRCSASSAVISPPPTATHAPFRSRPPSTARPLASAASPLRWSL